MTEVRLYPDDAGRRWSVTVDGDMVLTGSRDPEHDVARVLLGRGVTGTVEIRDGATGMVRSRIDVERAAGFTVTEENRDGLRARKHRPPYPDIEGSAGVDGLTGGDLPAEQDGDSGAHIWAA